MIECNLRASRSFPFISKTLNINFIEVATRMIMGEQPKKYKLAPTAIGVKVPMFSFTRLKGADPILGVEMASTGEVACFGRTKHEAYLKALLSATFRLPRRGSAILISIGSFREKMEFVPSAQLLHKLGFVLYGTPGTADFFTENNIPIKTCDFHHSTQGGEADEECISEMLTSNKIELVIDVPSNNKLRRPSNFMSRGYNMRRMAVDFSVPLITNIKCAKIFVDALYREGWKAKVSDIDLRLAHPIATVPGLIFSTLLGGDDTEILSGTTSCAERILCGGFTTIVLMLHPRLLLPGKHELAKKTDKYIQEVLANSPCDFSIYPGGNEEHATLSLRHGLEESGMRFSELVDSADVLAQWRQLFDKLPAGVPIVCSAHGTELGTVLLLGQLFERAVHFFEVRPMLPCRIFR